jgi:hypothetical protein
MPLDVFTRNFILKTFMKICLRFLPLLVGNRAKLSGTPLCMMTQVGFIVDGDIKSPYKPSLRIKLYEAPGRTEGILNIMQNAPALLYK